MMFFFIHKHRWKWNGQYAHKYDGEIYEIDILWTCTKCPKEKVTVHAGEKGKKR